MVARILRLKLRALGNSFRVSRKGFGAFLIWTLLGVILAGATVWAGLNTDLRIVSDFPELITIAGSAILALALVIPLFMRSSNLDPRQFTLFPVSKTAVAWGLGLSGFLSIPALLLVIGLAGYLVFWRENSEALLIAGAGAVLMLVAAVISASFSRGLALYAFNSSRARDFLNVVAAVFLISLLPVVFVLFTVDWSSDGGEVLNNVSDSLGWTPFGAALSAPLEFIAGNQQDAYLKVGIVGGYAIVLALLWRILVQAMMTHISRPPRTGIARSGMGWFDRVAATPAGVIGARSLTYWMRDPRYRVPMAILPFVPFAMMIPLAVATMPWNYVSLVPLPVLCLLLSWSVHNDVALDSTAIWLHVSSATRGIDDRRGRLLPVLLLGAPLAVVGTIVTLLFFGDWSALPSVIGISCGVLLVGSGVSSVISVLFPYAATRPGDSPFVQPQFSGSPAVLAQLSSLVITLALIFPAGYFAVLGLLQDPVYHLWALGIAVGTGLIVFALGLWGGGRLFDRRATELLAFTEMVD